MFDANARYVPKGVKFFACGSVGKGSIIEKLGLKSGQPVLCKMIDNSGRANNPRVSLKINGKVHVMKENAGDEGWSFLVYQGLPNGRGFICDKSKASCDKLIGGFNNTYWKR